MADSFDKMEKSSDRRPRGKDVKIDPTAVGVRTSEMTVYIDAGVFWLNLCKDFFGCRDVMIFCCDELSFVMPHMAI